VSNYTFCKECGSRKNENDDCIDLVVVRAVEKIEQRVDVIFKRVINLERTMTKYPKKKR
jgi:hypothetical protein